MVIHRTNELLRKVTEVYRSKVILLVSIKLGLSLYFKSQLIIRIHLKMFSNSE